MQFPKDPQAVLDYKWDWSDWLESGETITTRTVTADNGLTTDSDSITDAGKSVTAWFSGGTAGVKYRATCHIVTSAARTDDRTITLAVAQR